jgi:hypothetical protein
MINVNRRYSPVSSPARSTFETRAEESSPKTAFPAGNRQQQSAKDGFDIQTLQQLKEVLERLPPPPPPTDISQLDLDNPQVVEELAKKLGIDSVNLHKRTNDVEFDGALVGSDKAIKQEDLAGKKDLPPVKLADIEGFTPRRGTRRPSGETIIQINGINTTLEQQKSALQTTADATGAKVVGIHNATEGLAGDLKQSVTDKLNTGRNPAVESLRDVILTELREGRPVHLMAHSQGGLITSRALGEVADQLKKENKTALLDRIKVETFGAASGRYPDGPRYVHYLNKKDPVSNLFGVGGSTSFFSHPGKSVRGREAQIIQFSEKSLIEAHSFQGTYLQHRLDFDLAFDGPGLVIQQLRRLSP